MSGYRKVAAYALIIAVAGVCCWIKFKRATTSLALHLPSAIASGSFGDGSRIKLIRVTRGPGSHGELKGSGSGLHNSSTKAYIAAGNGRITLASSGIPPVLTGIGFGTNYPDPLVVEFQWLDPTGKLLRPRLVYSEGYLDSIRGGTSGFADKFMGSAGMIATTTPTDQTPDILVQLQDDKGNWISLDGPVVNEDDPNALCFAAIPALDRDPRTLKLRFVIRGQAPIEFSCPNPFPRPAAPILRKPTAVPATLSFPEGTVTLEKATVTPSIERFPLIDAAIRYSPSPGSQGVYRWRITEAEDSSGNRVPVGGFGFSMPEIPGSIQIRGEIEAKGIGPQTRAKCALVAEGLVQPDGSITLTLTDDGKKLGVVTASATALSKDGIEDALKFAFRSKEDLPGDPAIPLLGWTLSVHGKTASSTFPPQIPAHPLRWQLVMFEEGESMSSGTGHVTRSSTFSSFEPAQEFSTEVQWADRIPAGKKISVGICGPTPPVPVEFTIERSSLQAK